MVTACVIGILLAFYTPIRQLGPAVINNTLGPAHNANEWPGLSPDAIENWITDQADFKGQRMAFG